MVVLSVLLTSSCWSKSNCTHSIFPRWSQKVSRGMVWSLELLGSLPSLIAASGLPPCPPSLAWK